jgi:hypothetical protein
MICMDIVSSLTHEIRQLIHIRHKFANKMKSVIFLQAPL